jgi:excisionase family DNA binding protein
MFRLGGPTNTYVGTRGLEPQGPTSTSKENMTLRDLVTERQATAVKLAELDSQILLALAETRKPVQEDKLLTATEAARRLGISRVFLYEKARTGDVKSVRIGRAVRFRARDVEAVK